MASPFHAPIYLGLIGEGSVPRRTSEEPRKLASLNLLLMFAIHKAGSITDKCYCA